MVSKLGELIVRYRAAQQKVKDLLESAGDNSADLHAADIELTNVFDEIMRSQLQGSEHAAQRVHFLVEKICELNQNNGLVRSLSDKVLQDLADCQTSKGE